ncbi:uncharacterized protein LOC143793668 [Ranitomeya variabilis]|uniref:uncharacterized protein LOC143793668 n=1 Tax=Ranitomeya variabilis TaxID=490064 RepID=UPI004056B65F
MDRMQYETTGLVLHRNQHKEEVVRVVSEGLRKRFGITRSKAQIVKKWGDLKSKRPERLQELRKEIRRGRRRRQQPSATAGTPSSATSGSPQPGISHAVRIRRSSTPPQATTPPFRHSSSSPGSAAFSPEATLPAAAGAQARGWEVSSSSTSSGDDQPASLLQSTTVRDLLAKQRRLEGTAARLQGTAACLQEQVKDHGRMLRQLLAHRRGTM